MVLYMPNGKQDGFIYIANADTIPAADIPLIEVYTSNLTVSFQNMSLIQKLEYTAYYDPLTTLPNRSNFLRKLEKSEDSEHSHQVVCLLDISHFADINDGLGQDLGNTLLIAVANRLQSNLSQCVVARIAADVFGIYGPEPLVAPDFLLGLFLDPFQVGEHSLPLSVNIGFCRPLHKNEPRAWLMKYANIALNLAKRNLREPFEYFTDHMEEQVRWRLETINHLRQAFRDQILELWYQPQICTRTGKCCGLEALLRWPDAKAGFIPPSVFIPLAEYSGLIVDIGFWIIEEACRALGTLKKAGKHDITIAVNISIPQFRSPRFIPRVMEILERYAINPKQIEIEITEGLVMDEPKIVIDALESLRGSGFGVAIDDFGTGYSSMSYLQNLPIDTLKIDKSFVDRLDSPHGTAIVTAIANLCQTLGLKTVAEGVETALQLAVIQSLSCDLVQGFFYAQAMSISDLLPWLNTFSLQAESGQIG
jgi:EAL domain-containing protein (putative c-di-GMP-specific phosphodiesterase class I)/GGDEF domain-containing protein